MIETKKMAKEKRLGDTFVAPEENGELPPFIKHKSRRHILGWVWKIVLLLICVAIGVIFWGFAVNNTVKYLYYIIGFGLLLMFLVVRNVWDNIEIKYSDNLSPITFFEGAENKLFFLTGNGYLGALDLITKNNFKFYVEESSRNQQRFFVFFPQFNQIILSDGRVVDLASEKVVQQLPSNIEMTFGKTNNLFVTIENEDLVFHDYATKQIVYRYANDIGHLLGDINQEFEKNKEIHPALAVRARLQLTREMPHNMYSEILLGNNRDIVIWKEKVLFLSPDRMYGDQIIISSLKQGKKIDNLLDRKYTSLLAIDDNDNMLALKTGLSGRYLINLYSIIEKKVVMNLTVNGNIYSAIFIPKSSLLVISAYQDGYKQIVLNVNTGMYFERRVNYHSSKLLFFYSTREVVGIDELTNEYFIWRADEIVNYYNELWRG